MMYIFVSSGEKLSRTPNGGGRACVLPKIKRRDANDTNCDIRGHPVADHRCRRSIGTGSIYFCESVRDERCGQTGNLQGLLRSSHCQRAARQGAQEISVRVQEEGRKVTRRRDRRVEYQKPCRKPSPCSAAVAISERLLADD